MEWLKLLGKWWIRNGPGSIGSIARAMAKSYLTIKKNSPNLSRVELLKQTLYSRVQAWKILKQPVPEPEDKFLQMWVKDAKGSLTELTWTLVFWEHQELYEVDNEAFGTAREVVEEEIERYVPEEAKLRRWSTTDPSGLLSMFNSVQKRKVNNNYD